MATIPVFEARPNGQTDVLADLIAGPTAPVVVIGGAEDRRDRCEILREFVRLAGGDRARIAILTAATGEPEAAAATYMDVFRRLGAEATIAVHTRDRDEADRLGPMESIEWATGAFLTGGDQGRIVARVADTCLHSSLRQGRKRGLVVAGTSAGAAVMPDLAIVEGDSGSSPRLDSIEIGEGLGFLPGIVIDQHFAQRGRLGRLISILLQAPAVVGLGIDEDTAIVAQGEEFAVIGSGAVTVVDESDLTHTNRDRLHAGEILAACGIKLHVLAAGYRFNLRTREVILPGS